MAIRHQSKLEIRDELLRMRRAIVRDEVLERSARILGHLYDSKVYRGAQRLAAYIPILNESDLTPLFFRAQADEKEVYLPRLRENGTLAFARYEEGGLVKGPRGVMQPAAHLPEVALAELDLLLIPGVAFDARGYRLGLGAGYYDKTLAQKGTTPVTYGVGYAFQFVQHLPSDAWDVPLEGLLTEDGLHLYGASPK